MASHPSGEDPSPATPMNGAPLVAVSSQPQSWLNVCSRFSGRKNVCFGFLRWFAEGVDDREERWCEQDSPERNHHSQNQRNEERRPDGYAGDALHEHRLQQKLVDDDDDRVEAEQVEQALHVAAAEEDGEDRAEQADDRSEVGDEGHDPGDERPDGGERDMNEEQSDQPQDRAAEGLDGDGAPPVDEGLSGGGRMGFDVGEHG
jgi:hypothetical protein